MLRVRDVIQKHGNIKINIAFNGEFESGDKRANKSVKTKKLWIMMFFRSSNLEKWYESRVIESMTSLEEFQKNDSI